MADLKKYLKNDFNGQNNTLKRVLNFGMRVI